MYCEGNKAKYDAAAKWCRRGQVADVLEQVVDDTLSNEQQLIYFTNFIGEKRNHKQEHS